MRLVPVLSACSLLLCASMASAAVSSIPLQPAETDLALAAQSSNELRFEVAIGELATMDVNTPEGEFTRLLIPGFHTSKIAGAPELPQMNRMIAIPFGATARLEIEKVESRMVDLADFGVTNLLMPVQPSMPKNVNPDEWPFVFDRAAYATDKVAQELVRFVSQGRLRAMDLGRIEISPVEYFPQTNQIKVTERVEFKVVFEGADFAKGSDLIERTSSPFFDFLYQWVVNDRWFHDAYPDRVQNVVTMVVITPPEFEAQMQQFVDWKTERGFHMIVGVIGNPEVGTTTASIQAYLHGLYNTPPADIPAPSFVLFVGDVAQCPTFFQSGDATDRPYCAVDGDLVPDMYYGRFSATNPTQLQAILDKSLMYDQFTLPDPSYLGEVVMIAGMDGGFGDSHGNGQINYGTEHYFNSAHGIFSHTYLYPESGSNAANIVQNVSDGVSYINYTAHGSQTSWSNPSFTQSNINSLNNYGEYCLAVGNCCLTSTYDYGECFAETWLRADGKGAIGYIGGSNSTYWDEDYWWGVGYHPSSQINGDAWPYESTGIGVYDGLFHDHGEEDHLWYVTNDAIVFAGNLAVMESGSTRTTYYWNIYNLMGDPSISTYVGVPTANPVVHPETVFTSWTSMTVEAEHGSYVGLTQDGVLVGAGTVDATGSLDIEFLQQPLTPGVPLHMVVMAQNRVPFVVDINVIVPATVLIDPMVIDANATTDITVTVLDADGINPQPGINIWAEGLDYATTPVPTDASGVAVITVNYPYGPTLDIVGQDPAETYRLFAQPITVNALALSMPDLTVTTDIGLTDAFALNLPGTLHATVVEKEHILFAELPDGSQLSTTDPELTLTPNQLGSVMGIIAVSGYNLYTEAFEVIEAYGTLTGTVATGGTPLAGVVVTGYDDAMEVVFQAMTNGSGDYDMGEEILVADYTIVVDHFGYLHYETPFFLNYGANVFDITLDPAPSGILTGTVTGMVGEPLQASIKVYRTDNGALYTETASDPVDGSYTTSSLPYFDYEVKVRAFQHVPATLVITIEDPVVEKHFVLEETNGDILVVDDGSKGGPTPVKYDYKGQTFLATGYLAVDGKAATDIVTDLENLGYYVTLEDVGTTNPATWTDYDLVVMSSGNNIGPLASTSTRNALINFVNEGGHLLIEGGEVAYDHYYGDPTFCAVVLHTTGWNHDSSGNVTVADPGHNVMSVPNVITGPLNMTYDGYGDQDAVDVAADAVMVGSWTSYPSDGSVIAYDTNPAPDGGQIVFYAFNYSAMEAAGRSELLENSVLWLITPEFGTASVAGTVQLQGESDHSGITVQAIPNGGSVITGPEGSYELTGLFAGPYQIRASKEGWSIDVEDVVLEENQAMAGIDLVLTPVYAVEQVSTPSLPIPDNSGTGCGDSIEILTAGTVTGVEVFVDITHTYIGDLIVELTSPAKSSVILHNRTGGSENDLYGWYPLELTPAEALDGFIGEEMAGSWTMHVSDHANIDVGTFNEWRLRIFYGNPVSPISDDQLPTVLALGENYPNPFNPQTKIDFDLPRTQQVDLAVYDVTGRRVATLVAEQMPAGRHQAIWDGRDSEGRAASSGMYFYRLVADKEIMTGKMMLVK